jgi:hypothetical protein
MGNQTVTRTDVRAEYGFEVISSDDKGQMLEVEYKDRKLEIITPEQRFNTDFSCLIGQKGRFALSKTGEVSGFSGFEDLPAITIAGDDLTLDSNHYMNELKWIFLRLPDAQIRVGDTWSFVDEYSEETGGGLAGIVIDYTCTLLDEVEVNGHRCLKIGGEYTIIVEGKNVSGGVEFDIKLKGKGSGSIYLDRNKGMISSIDEKSIVEGTAVNSELEIVVPIKQERQEKIDIRF